MPDKIPIRGKPSKSKVERSFDTLLYHLIEIDPERAKRIIKRLAEDKRREAQK